MRNQSRLSHLEQFKETDLQNLEFIIIDGNNLVYRNHFGYKAQRSSYPGTYGSLLFLADLYALFGDAVDYLLAWDSGRSKERMAIYPDYKSNRDGKMEKRDLDKIVEDCRSCRDLCSDLPPAFLSCGFC